MPKPMYVWTGTAWVSVASEVESLATYATQSYADNQPGMKLVVPSSVTVGSGSGSVSTQGTVSFSGASSVSLNSCFSSTYDDYLLLLDLTSGSVDCNVNLRLRASGSDISTGTAYNYALNGYTTAAAVSDTSSNGANELFICELDGAGPSNSTATVINIFNPRLALAKPGVYQTMYLNQGGTAWVARNGGFIVRNTTQCDGVTFLTSTGTMTGTVRVYGYKIG